MDSVKNLTRSRILQSKRSKHMGNQYDRNQVNWQCKKIDQVNNFTIKTESYMGSVKNLTRSRILQSIRSKYMDSVKNLTRSRIYNQYTSSCYKSDWVTFLTRGLTHTPLFFEIVPVDGVSLGNCVIVHEFRTDLMLNLVEKRHGREFTNLLKFWQGFSYRGRNCEQIVSGFCEQTANSASVCARAHKRTNFRFRVRARFSPTIEFARDILEFRFRQTNELLLPYARARAPTTERICPGRTRYLETSSK